MPMLFPEEDTPHLKKWIVKRLENTSDADADVLADYVLALLRHDGDLNSVRALCESEIPDFLKEDTSLFVQDVFEAIQYKSYLPGALPRPPKQVAPPFLPPNGPSAMSYPGGMGHSNGAQNGSRKRSFHEQAGADMGDVGNFQYSNGMRNFKQPRRGGNPIRGGRFDSNFDSNRGGRMYQPSPPIQQQAPGFPPLHNPQSPIPGLQLDPNNPMAAFLALQQAMGQQAMGINMPGMNGMPPTPFPLPSPTGPGADYRSQSITRPHVQRCRDYDQQGFCTRGNNCNFEHGSGSIYVPPVDEYDPSNSSLMPSVQPSPTNGAAPRSFSNNAFADSGRGGHDSGRGRGNTQRGGGDRGGLRGGSRRGGRSEFSSDRPNYDRTNTSIVVENIPEEKFTEDHVREFFSAFGNVVEVMMRPYKRLAIVKYDDWNSAKDAYSSPQVIFDNRFVKVYWYISENNLPQPPKAVAGSNGGPAINGRNGSANATPGPRATSEASVDMEEFAIKQQEAQKAQDEKAKKRLETEAAIKEMKIKQEALLKSHAEEQQKLMERLAAKTGKPVKTEDGSTTNENSEVERLKALLAAKKAEAERIGALGMDSSLGDDASSWRGRGRGRGGYRGRGTYAPRGAYRGYERGGYRGRGAGIPFIPRGGGAYNLDNRPKKIVLTGIDFTEPEKNESLGELLLGYEHTELETGFEKTYIAFADRKTAERFIASAPNGEMPSIGKVEMNWVPNGPLPPVKPTASSKNEDTVMDEGDAMAQDESSMRATHAAEQQQEVDYDVADDNDWAE